MLLLFSLALAAGRQAFAQAEWPVDRRPALDISASGQSGAIVFENAGASLRMEDGSVVIADIGAMLIRFFDSTGKTLKSVGGPGTGPGEFRSIYWMGRCARDSLFVFDMNQRRMSVITRNDGVVRQFAFPAGAGPSPLTLSCSTTGRFATLVPLRGAPHVTANIVRASAELAIASQPGESLGVVDTVALGEVALLGRGSAPRPLGRFTSVAASGSSVVVATGDSSTVAVFEQGTGGGRVVSLPISRRRATREQFESAIARIENSVPGPFRATAREGLMRLPLPDLLPPYTAVLADGTGSIGIVVPSPNDSTTALLVVDLSGRVLGKLTLPRAIDVVAVSANHIVGIYEDDNALQHVVVYRFARRS